MSTGEWHHRLDFKTRDAALLAQTRIERHLSGVKCDIRLEGREGDWRRHTLYFTAPGDASLDFLRPDILPPREGS